MLTWAAAWYCKNTYERNDTGVVIFFVACADATWMGFATYCLFAV